MRADFGADYVGVTTAVQDDMQALGCTEYHMDVAIRVPRGVPLLLRKKEGDTNIANLVSDLQVEQEAGDVHIKNVQGKIKIVVNDGTINTESTAGQLELAAAGDISVLQPFGDVRVQCDGGNTIIDTPSAGVFARTKGGDVRLIAVDGVKSDYDIETEDGNISLAVPESADAMFLLNVEDGNYRSSVPVTGTSQGTNHTFQGKLNTGLRRILLAARRGNIVID